MQFCKILGEVLDFGGEGVTFEQLSLALKEHFFKYEQGPLEYIGRIPTETRLAIESVRLKV